MEIKIVSTIQKKYSDNKEDIREVVSGVKDRAIKIVCTPIVFAKSVITKKFFTPIHIEPGSVRIIR